MILAATLFLVYRTLQRAVREGRGLTATRRLAMLRAVSREHDELESHVHSFETVSGLLAICIYPESYFRRVNPNSVVCREDFAGTRTTLVFDLPSTVRAVKREEANAWGKEDSDLFELALENLRQKVKPEIVPTDLGDGNQAFALGCDGPFAASLVLALKDFPGCVGRHGSLVGIPVRNMVVCYPIDDLRVIPAIQKMIQVVYEMAHREPRSVSPELFWYRSGHFLPLPYRVKAKRLEFTPPAPFIEMLNELPNSVSNASGVRDDE